MKDKLAIIVPFRDREKHLNVFVPHMHNFLKDKGIDYDIFIIEQVDDRPFNYGKLCNAAVKEVGEEYTYFAFHDIDMLPISDECDYGYPDSPTHLATNVEAHDNKLPYPQYFGGVVVISREDFEKANGYSNEYWGYGFEDIDLLYRLQKSGAYLEKYYDSNQTYKRYDENDILPYRIENVNICNTPMGYQINYFEFDEKTNLYGTLNPISNTIFGNSFTISLWFNDDTERSSIKNIFTFEGCDTGLFLSNGNQLIAQIWDTDENHFEIATNYARNRWNHVVFNYDKNDNKIVLFLNNNKFTQKLPDKFTIYDYRNHCIKVSDSQSEIKIGEIVNFEGNVDEKIVNLLYYKGNNIIDILNTQYGITPIHKYNFEKLYKNQIILDEGKHLNHLPLIGNHNSKNTEVKLTDDVFLPFRLEGEYKSLKHKKDKDIIEKYYEYNPDIEENADIFFHDIINGNLDFKTLGLNTIKYKIMDIKDIKTHKLIRIVT